jgi:serine/threonine-protein kinase
VWPKAKAEAQQALALDPDLAPAHAALGHAVLFYDWDWQRAREELDRALALDPNHAPTYHWYAHYWMTQNNWDKAIEASRKAVELEPANLFLRGHLLYFLAATRRTDELIAEGRKAAELDRDFWVIHTGAGLAALQQHRLPEAIAELEKARERSGGLGIAITDLGYAYAVGGQAERARKMIAELEAQGAAGHSIATTIAGILAALGEKDRAFASLERAYRDHDPMLLFLKAWYWFDNIRGDPRYEDLVRRVGLR